MNTTIYTTISGITLLIFIASLSSCFYFTDKNKKVHSYVSFCVMITAGLIIKYLL